MRGMLGRSDIATPVAIKMCDFGLEDVRPGRQQRNLHDKSRPGKFILHAELSVNTALDPSKDIVGIIRNNAGWRMQRRGIRAAVGLKTAFR